MPSAAQCCPDEIPCRTLQLALGGTGACLGGASCSWPTQQLPMRNVLATKCIGGQGSSYELGVFGGASYEPCGGVAREEAALSEQDATIVGRVETKPEGHFMDVQFIASIAVIAPDPSVSRRFYVDALGLPLMGSEDDYLHSEDIDGTKSFGVWPLTQAAQACFGTPGWPADRPVPQASIEFEVADADAVQVGADELKEKGVTRNLKRTSAFRCHAPIKLVQRPR